MKTFYVYIMASKSKTLYVGMTSDLKRRVYQHKNHLLQGFTDKYNIDKLVHYETTNSSWSAIEREKQIKRWRREKKIGLIEQKNKTWEDLCENWFD